MTSLVHTVELFALAGAAFLAFGSMLTHVVVRALGSRLTGWDARSRHRALVVLATLPIAIAAALLLAASLPSLVALAVPGRDHCVLHDDGHAHLCFVHGPPVGIHFGFVAALGILALGPAVRGALAMRRLRHAQRIVTALAATGELHPELGITLVESDRPMCFTAGLLRPRVLISRGLFDALAPEERAVVLAHERAHVRRRDALTAGLVQLLGVLHAPAVRRWLARETAVAAEQACDDDAAAIVRDRIAVAAAILAVERATQRDGLLAPLGVAVAFGACAVERRVASLLGEPVPTRSLGGITVFGAVAVTAVLALANEVHHLTESLLALVAH